jgi:photosystem II stability/assembly factor-like uncharacterized protein
MYVCLSPNGRSQSQSDEAAMTLLVGTVKGVYTLQRSSLGGRWEMASRALADLHISSLLHETRSDTIFAGAHNGGGLFASTDGGKTWEDRTTGLSSQHVYSLAAQERDGRVVLYAGTEPAALHRSYDLGETWHELSSLTDVPNTEKWTFPPPPHIAHVKNVIFDPRDASVIYAAVEQGALLKTTDAGETWREIETYATPEDSQYKDIHRLAVHKAAPDTIFMSTGVGVYRTRDAGESWDRLTTESAPVGYPDPIFVDPADPNTVFVAGGRTGPAGWRGGFSNATVLRSRDGGAHFEDMHNGLPDEVRGNFEAMSLHESPAGIELFIGTASGEIFSSSDRGESWQLIIKGLPAFSKSGHYRHFLPEEEKRTVEAAMQAQRRS